MYLEGFSFEEKNNVVLMFAFSRTQLAVLRIGTFIKYSKLFICYNCFHEAAFHPELYKQLFS
jgi:hypothetical protein